MHQFTPPQVSHQNGGGLVPGRPQAAPVHGRAATRRLRHYLSAVLKRLHVLSYWQHESSHSAASEPPNGGGLVPGGLPLRRRMAGRRRGCRRHYLRAVLRRLHILSHCRHRLCHSEAYEPQNAGGRTPVRDRGSVAAAAGTT